MYEMTIRTEDSTGRHAIFRTYVHETEVAERREHYRSTAPRGCTRTITTNPVTR